MSVKVHESFSIDSFQDRLLWYDDFLGDQLQDEWRSTGSAGGSGVVVDAQTGGIVRLTTDGDSGDNWRMDWTTIRSFLVSKKVTIEARVKPNHATFLILEIALRFDASNLIRFRASEGAGGATNWFIQTIDGGAPTSSDSGIALDTDYHIFRIEAFPTGEVHFFIDGVETTNSPITTNIPDDATDYFEPWFFIQASENSAKSMDVDYVVVRQEI